VAESFLKALECAQHAGDQHTVWRGRVGPRGQGR